MPTQNHKHLAAPPETLIRQKISSALGGSVGLFYPGLTKRPDLNDPVNRIRKLLANNGTTLLENSPGSRFNIALSGDGGVLGLHRHVQTELAAYVGFNTGHVGAISEMALTDLEVTLQKILNGNYDLVPLARIAMVTGLKQRSIDIWNNTIFSLGDAYPMRHPLTAINEIFFRSQRRSLNIVLYMEAAHPQFGAMLKLPLCDGLMLYTPTGYTGWAHEYFGEPIEPGHIGVLPVGTQNRHPGFAIPAASRLGVYIHVPKGADAICCVDALRHTMTEGIHHVEMGSYPIPFFMLRPSGFLGRTVEEIIARKKANVDAFDAPYPSTTEFFDALNLLTL